MFCYWSMSLKGLWDPISFFLCISRLVLYLPCHELLPQPMDIQPLCTPGGKRRAHLFSGWKLQNQEPNVDPLPEAFYFSDKKLTNTTNN